MNMNAKRFSTLAAIAALWPSSHTHAAYIGLGGELHAQVTIDGTMRNVFRIYAVFDNPNDYLVGAFGAESVGPLIIKSNQGVSGTTGSSFVNPAGGGNLAPNIETLKVNPDAQWDSFVTVGVPVDEGSDNTGLSPGFPPQFGGQFILGNSATAMNVAWFVPGAMEQSRAGGPNGVAGKFTNGEQTISGLGVLLMQLTVNAGSGVEGTIAVAMDLAGGVAGGSNIPMQTFFMAPTAGTLLLLPLCLLSGRRGRR
jgi:hypothetical protein